MEMVLSSGFCEMTQNEMLVVDGGDWQEAAQIGAFLVGTLLLEVAPIVGLAAGVSASVATPIVGYATGIAAYASITAAGAACFDFACK